MPACNRCSSVKDSSEFYPKDKTCKECRKAMVRQHRADNIEKCRAYDRARGRDPKRLQAVAEYQKTERGKEVRRKSCANYYRRNADRRSAHVVLGNAVRDGKVWVSPCCMTPGCQSTKGVEAHHTAYDYPLGVDWLCSKCHKTLHREHRARQRTEHTNQQ